MTLSKLSIFSFAFLFIASFIWGCSMFFEEDIDSEDIIIIAPTDGSSTEILTQTFWWNSISGADKYRLQIVSPSFDETETLLLDSLLEGDKFEETMYPGEFQWRIRGENSAYVTEWTYASFSVFSSEDLTRQRLVLKSPTVDAFLSAERVTFTWDHLVNAKSYNLMIYAGAWGQDAVFDSSEITDTNVTLDNLEEKAYWWGVKAKNEISETLYSNRRLVIDRTSPVKPILKSPLNNAVLSDSTVVFSWDSSDPVWDVVVDKLNIVEVLDGSEDIPVHSETYTEKSVTIKLNKGKKYSWNVQTFDQAENESEISENRLFSVKE